MEESQGFILPYRGIAGFSFLIRNRYFVTKINVKRSFLEGILKGDAGLHFERGEGCKGFILKGGGNAGLRFERGGA